MDLANFGRCICEHSLKCETDIFMKYQTYMFSHVLHDYKYQNAGWLSPMTAWMSTYTLLRVQL